jgi:hypothetical protein
MNDRSANRLPVNPVMTGYHRELQKVLHLPFRKVTGMDTKKLTRVQVYDNIEMPMATGN